MPSSDSPPRSSLSAIDRYFQVSLYLLLLTSVATLVSTGKLDLFSTIVAPAAMLVKGYRWLRGRGPEISHRTATWLVAAYFLFFPVDLLVISRALATPTPNPALYAALLAAIHLMLFGTLVRLLSASTTRDYLFLCMLAFATMLAAAILTVDTAFFGFFLVFLAMAVSTFVALEMRRSAESAAIVAPVESGTPAARRLHRALGLTCISVTLSSLVVGAVIFFIIPRFSAGYMSGFSLQPSLISAFTDNVELGQIGEIKKNDALVMRVRVQGGPERARNVRWRGIALTTFDGKRWTTSEGRDPIVILPSGDGWYVLGRGSPRARQTSVLLGYTILLEPMATDSLFVATHVERLRGRLATFLGGGGRALRRSYLVADKTDSLFNPFHNFNGLRYEGISYIPAASPAQLQAASTDYPDEIRDIYLQLPKLDPRIAALTRQVTSAASTPYEKAAILELFLRTRYGYTLDLSGTPPADPLAHFLFERRAGHCEYFAAAMTVMLRSLGIPARYVNGFLPGEYNEVGEDFIIRSRDAHSWVEVYFPEYGWIPFDPTPASEERGRSWLGYLALYWDWVELTWSEWVINYDFLHQLALAQNVQRVSRAWTEGARQALEGVRRTSVERLKAWQARAIEAPYAVALVLASLATLVVVLRRRAIHHFFSSLWHTRLFPDADLTPHMASLRYAQMLRLLARRGLAKPPGQTPLEFAASIPRRDLSLPVARLTELYHLARFGARPADARKMAELLRYIKMVFRAAR